MEKLVVNVRISEEEKKVIDSYRMELSDSIPDALSWSDKAILECIVQYALDCLKEKRI